MTEETAEEAGKANESSDANGKVASLEYTRWKFVNGKWKLESTHLPEYRKRSSCRNRRNCRSSRKLQKQQELMRMQLLIQQQKLRSCSR